MTEEAGARCGRPRVLAWALPTLDDPGDDVRYSSLETSSPALLVLAPGT